MASNLKIKKSQDFDISNLELFKMNIKKIGLGIKKEFHAQWDIIDLKLIKFFSQTKFLSSLYYVFFSNEFDREHQSVLAGKLKHIRSKENFYLVVRNIHRIEKGLLMKPCRNVFALSYIEETINALQDLVNGESYDKKDLQFKWFFDVLSEYFDVVDQNESTIKKNWDKFREIKKGFFNESIKIIKSTPYTRELKKIPPVSYEDLYSLARLRRSVRWFKQQPVPRELVDKALLIANQAPSACNRQPFEYHIIDDPHTLRKVSKFPMGTVGYADNIPMLVVAVGNLDAYFSERDRHLIYIDASLANMSLMLALETLKLSSCAINWPDIDSREKLMKKFLNLKDYQRPIMCLAIGYPDDNGMVAFSEKKDLKKLRKYN